MKRILQELGFAGAIFVVFVGSIIILFTFGACLMFFVLLLDESLALGLLGIAFLIFVFIFCCVHFADKDITDIFD